MTLAAIAPLTGAVAVDESYLYWAQWMRNGNVLRVALAGGDVQTLAAHQARPLGVAVDDTSVYWTTYTQSDDGQVLRLLK